MSDFIDLHCHVLPGLDDGPADAAAARALVEELAELGFAELHPTPHQMARRWRPSAAARLQAAVALRSDLTRVGCKTRICEPAGENMWDELFFSRQHEQSFPAYQGDRAFLIEFPRGPLPPRVPEQLFEFRLRGRLPVIAHIERYSELLEKPTLLVDKAALLVNLSTLGGGVGWALRRRTRQLVQQGLVHALATDAHTEMDVKPTAAGLAWVYKSLGQRALRHLLVDAPRQILAGELPDPWACD